jgi:hypothetical protein
MGVVFQIIGVLCVAFLILIVVTVMVIKHKLKKALGSFEGSVTKTPSRIHLQRQDSITWDNEDQVKATLEPLQKNGFTGVGFFTLQEMPVKMAALAHSGQQIYAVVYEHPAAGVWADIYSRYREGQPLKNCTYSNVHHAGADQLDTPPYRKSVKVPGLAIEALYQRFINERPAYELEAVQPDQFAALFEKAYADEMDWRNSRGGPTEEEIRRVAAATGRVVDDATVKEARRRLAPQDAPPAS